MNDWPLGLSTGCFYKRPLSQSLPAIIKAGFTIIEISSSPSHIDIEDLSELEKIAEFLRREGIAVCSLHAPFSKEIDITSPNPAEREFSQALMHKALDAAVLLGSRYLVMHPWPEKEFPAHSPERKERKKAAEEFIAHLSKAGRYRGITLALENMQPHLLISPMRDLLWIREETEEQDVVACFDTGHAFLTGDFRAALHDLAPHIEIIHAHDNRGSNDDHFAPGKGDIDWRAFIKELVNIDFDGTILFELDDKDGVSEKTVLEDANSARGFLREIMQDNA
jgi:sugar phosphate isomerase/epimerase